jgi:hypothetical protein
MRFLPRVWVVEARQLNGMWKPVAIPSRPPFTELAATRLMKDIIRNHPFLGSRRFPLRVTRYEQALQVWKETAEPYRKGTDDEGM